jgi:hypothetical protein
MPGMGTAATIDELNRLFAAMEDVTAREMEAAEKLNSLRISNAEELAKLQLDLMTKNAQREADIRRRSYERAIKEGLDIIAVREREEHQLKLQEIDERLARELALIDETDTAARAAAEARAAADKQRLVDEEKTRRRDDEAYRKRQKKLDDAYRKEKGKKDLEAMNSIKGELDPSHIRWGGRERARKKLAEQNITDEKEQNRIMRAASADGLQKALAGFAKQLENTATSVAEAQSEVDTRLQGSKNDKSVLGSYWSRMMSHVTGNIGMSPFLKQETAVKNLQTLVGKGIAFNVEQRAFLDTISEKIATTFEATDASLLKLVRIQQADSTAARLGMESALTAFLNNMYETTEYMTEAADSIRASIYEASALMTAEEATDFEYQVQKWMGSLYSVGFQNTQGLSDALGKLAAGDISGITDNGYGNLLVMAANKANLSIAEILQDGLNDDETNALMHAMVEYLGGIYTETKDNKVVAQQFANVYGLTASDLKAAANLASSTTNVYENNLNYGGMMQQLTDMANSMGSRTSLGTMVQNIFENFKYSTAASIGNDPVLYSTYMIASMLDDTVGGIAIPTIGAFAMGNGVEIDLETTVADLMRTGAMAGGLLGGIGKMIGGIAKGSGGGFSGSGMLKAFGVDLSGSGATTVTRGTGANLLVTESGMDTSYSGYIGNEDGSLVKEKAITDAKDEANQQAIQALEEAQEIGLSNVDEHVVQIYTLLNEFAIGSRNLHVTFGGTEGNSWSNSSGYSPSGVPML